MKFESSAYSFANGLLELANDLKIQSDTHRSDGDLTKQDMYLRSCISRAYYGVYHHLSVYARDRYKKLGGEQYKPENKASDHGALGKWLEQHDLKFAFNELTKARKLRNAVEYTTSKQVSYVVTGKGTNEVTKNYKNSWFAWEAMTKHVNKILADTDPKDL